MLSDFEIRLLGQSRLVRNQLRGHISGRLPLAPVNSTSQMKSKSFKLLRRINPMVICAAYNRQRNRAIQSPIFTSVQQMGHVPGTCHVPAPIRWNPFHPTLPPCRRGACESPPASGGRPRTLHTASAIVLSSPCPRAPPALRRCLAC